MQVPVSADNFRRAIRSAVASGLIIGMVAFLMPSPASAASESDRQSPQQTQAAFSQQYPKAKFHRAATRITRVYGSPFGNGARPEATAEQFRQDYAALFGVSAADLRPESLLHDKRHTQPLMYLPQTGQYKFTLVYYSQYQNGIPVFRADLRLLVRNETGHPLVLASVGLRDLGSFEAAKAPAATESPKLGQAAARELIPTLANFTKPQRIVWAGVEDMIVQPTVAYAFEGNNDGVAGDAIPESWLFVADATTGNILYRESLIHHTDVEGNVSGLATQGVAADFCEPEELEVMPYARVSIGGTQAFADEFGNFVIPNNGDSSVTVESPIRGQYFVVTNFSGPDSLLFMDVVPPGPANFTHNAGNTSQFVRSEVNCYIHANIIRDWTLRANPNYGNIPSQLNFPVNVNRTNGFCPGNAWYTSSPPTINFCSAGGNNPNTGWNSVVYHEYGHHIVNQGGSPQGAFGEGTGDAVSAIILDDPRLAVGFFNNCSQPLRNADNNMQYPCSGGIHFCGQLFSGSVWSTRNQMVITEPTDYSEILMSLMINSVPLNNSGPIAQELTIDWLTVDDDDSDLENGTPHCLEITTGFGEHNMIPPGLEFEEVAFQYPDGRPVYVTPDESTLIRVNINGACGGDPVGGTGTLSYRINNIGPFETVEMTEVSPNEYEGTIPPADCLATVHYFFSVDVDGVGVLSDPSDAPLVFYSALATTGPVTPFADDFETDTGWTVTNSEGLETGAWERGVPVDEPGADGDGSGQAYVTGNAVETDVDGGTTTLTSPTMNASLSNTVLSYYRWFFAGFTDSPDDAFVVEVSDDSGDTWITLETVETLDPEASGDWIYKEFALASVPGLELNNQFRVRFTASDTGIPNIIEAGVDGVQLTGFSCSEGCPGDLSGDGSVGAADLAMLLGAWGSNPGHPADFDEDGVVGASDLAFLLGNWGVCL
ncbi:MAG: hypothetical protein IID41_01205 [Planctomycetes bacterium]|nr:hypothetical protein [Planctomycetota bacterium]